MQARSVSLKPKAAANPPQGPQRALGALLHRQVHAGKYQIACVVRDNVLFALMLAHWYMQVGSVLLCFYKVV